MASTAEKKSEVNLLPCTFKFHNFVAKISDININCQVIKMEDCLYLWIGDFTNGSMGDLSFALTSNLERQPISTKIMGIERRIQEEFKTHADLLSF
ncbi:PREDICTED: uncharacterized protein LOC105461391 isoform X2 [Wasmannia auropunctata]|uniref:uncharacterized protein LOC105461391 isoform X2 n=1 Tax=Wasmannia auropunctata TaxID=64793 RepID=UPI0005EE64D0|nr:PREDICTED: uncharacterized protein LOC105461391 isoform X2 [Wasmannia auropunctata]